MIKKRKSKLSWVRSRIIPFFLSAVVSVAAAQQQVGQLEGELRLNGKETWKAFDPVREVLQESSAVIYNGWKSVAYGVIVSPDGYLVTKASEIEGVEELSVRVNREHFKKVKVVSSTVEWDVALLKVEAQGLPVIEWAAAEPTHGTWVVSNGSTTRRDRRLRVGIISANSRKVGEGRAPVVLGVTLDTSGEQEGLLVKEVQEDSGASEAGMKSGDLILEMEGLEVKSMEDLQELLGSKEPGDKIQIRLRREGEDMELEVELKRRESVFEEEKTRNDAMSGRVSKRRSDFPRVLQTDLPLSVRSVGGPLLNLEGQCVGMNIARANRCETFAIPAKELLATVDFLMTGEESGSPRE